MIVIALGGENKYNKKKECESIWFIERYEGL